MSEVGRFGVFLPSYVWEGDGGERARGIKAFAREGHMLERFRNHVTRVFDQNVY